MQLPLRRLATILLASTVAFSTAATAAPSGRRMYKPYVLTAPPPVNAVSTNAQASGATVCATTDAEKLKVASDPEEGGQIARTAPAPAAKPTVGDITVTKPADTASTKLMADAAPASSCQH